MKRLAVLASLLVAACSSSTSSTPGPTDLPASVHGDGQIDGKPDTSEKASPGAMSDSMAAGGASATRGGGNGTITPGTLTSGVWDDNRNFDLFTKLRGASQAEGIPSFTADEQAAAHAKAAAGPKKRLDVQIMIDTTGSMGDEIRYLDTEFDAITSTIQAKYPGAAQQWSLVAYKDVHDPYIVRWFDFRSDLTELHAKLTTLEASGGGDFPESPERALDVATRLGWRQEDDVARVIFWVADAPHHVDDADAMTNAIRAARDKGIHVYPVAASGIDAFTEYTMRSAAQITGGRYVFLTDDAGVGDAHETPSVPCFFVTKLNDAIYRMVDIELSGTYHEPVASEILRTGGDPQNGACQVDGASVTIY